MITDKRMVSCTRATGTAGGRWPSRKRHSVVQCGSRSFFLSFLIFLRVVAGPAGFSAAAVKSGPLERAQSEAAQVGASGAAGLLRRIDLGDPQCRHLIRQTVERTLRFLAASQDKETGALGSKYQVAITSLAGLAFLGAGYGYQRGTYGTNVELCVRYLLKVAQSSPTPGFLAKAGEDHPMHGHGYALLFLTQVFGELPVRRQEAVRGVIRRGIKAIALGRSWRGGWYYHVQNRRHQDENSVTVCVLQALRAARNVGFSVDSGLITGAERYLRQCQKRDGSFCYSLSGGAQWSSFELTAGAVASLQALGLYGSGEVSRGIGYLKRCLAEVPGRPLDAARRYRFYGNLYASQAFYQAGGSTWRSWYPAAFRQLIEEARPAGDGLRWESHFGPQYATAVAALILEVPLGYLPIFEK